MRKSTRTSLAVLSFLLSIAMMNSYAQDVNPLEGRWDLKIAKDGDLLPSWLEIEHSGSHTLVGRFVYASGSARPISQVVEKDGKFKFSIPVQWEPGHGNMVFEGQLAGKGMKGTMLFTDGKKYNWEATKSPRLEYTENPDWGEPIKLFNGDNLLGWYAMGENQWVSEDGILRSPKSGANLVSDQTFRDFKLHIEFRYPKGSNSGVYLRGRYELQIVDSEGMEPSSTLLGGVYGFLAPNQTAAKKAGEWQSYDVTLIGRRVTVTLNDKTVICEQNIPGITGGALDSNEGEPGPVMLQGDHGPIEFRNITVVPRIEQHLSHAGTIR